VVEHGRVDLEAAHLVRILGSAVPHVLDVQDGEPPLGGQPVAQRLVERGDVRVVVVQPEGQVDPPVAQGQPDVVTLVAALAGG
jgi:hypothetical protein